MQMIVVEGNIGAGKSTLTKQLAERLDAQAFFEPVDTNPYLEDYYKNPKHYALPMQFFLMSNRFEMHQRGIEHLWRTGQNCIYDRSIYGDYVFAKKNWLDGNMSDLDFENYNKMRRVMFKHLMVPHIVLYLDNDPETTLKNVNNRSRDCESSIPIEYLKGLDELYNDLKTEMRELGSQVIEIDWNEFKPVDWVLEQLEPHLGPRHKMSVIERKWEPTRATLF